MPRKKKVTVEVDKTELLVNTIVKAIQDKKGKDVITIDLRNLDTRVADFFVICHGDSTTQVSAIGDNVDYYVKKQIEERPWHSEGFQNSEWILIDYVNVVVHIFLNEKRDFYNLEKLWADGIVSSYSDEPSTQSKNPVLSISGDLPKEEKPKKNTSKVSKPKSIEKASSTKKKITKN
jgi:ribosome-associated protein